MVALKDYKEYYFKAYWKGDNKIFYEFPNGFSKEDFLESYRKFFRC